MIDLGIFVTLVVLGYVFGHITERRHFESIRRREAELAGILTFSERIPPPSAQPPRSHLVGGNTVVSIDYFKRIAAGLRGLIGGRVNAYESLLERARREAIIRMKLEAKTLGASSIINVKLETASISKGKKNQTGCVEVYAYGTALIPRRR